jgi:hypothetical protein
MPTPKLSTVTQPISAITQEINSGAIKVPAFQRGFVWTQEQIIALLDSIYNNYPIGSVLLWETDERLDATRNVGGFLIPETKEKNQVKYILDGQQRLSTIYALFNAEKKQDSSDDKYKMDVGLFDIYFDLDQCKFISEEEIDESAINLLKAGSLLDFNSLMAEMAKLVANNENNNKALDLYARFIGYQIPIVTISERQKEEVGIIFERINNSNTDLNTLDLMVAWTWSTDFHLREAIDELLEELSKKDFDDVPHKVILQTISAIIQKDVKTKKILILDPGEVRGRFSSFVESMERACDFLSTELSVSREFLPHVQQLVSLSYFFSLVTSPNGEQSEVLKKWFWKTSFSKRYSAQTDDKINNDLAFFDKVSKGDYSGLEDYSYSIDIDSLIQQKLKKDHPFVRSYLLLLAQKQPLNLVNGNKVDLREPLSKYNRKEYHHIFPQAFLKAKSIDNDVINSMCNFCFLPSTNNKTISARAPSDYFFNLIPPNKVNQILKSNLMPTDMNIYQRDDFENFLKQRAQEILSYLDELLK